RACAPRRVRGAHRARAGGGRARSRLRLRRRKHCRQRPALEERGTLEPSDVGEVEAEAFDQLASAFGMLALAATEEHDRLHLGARAQELERTVALPRVVVRADPRPQPHLLERDVHLVLPARAELPLLLVAPLAVV